VRYATETEISVFLRGTCWLPPVPFPHRFRRMQFLSACAFRRKRRGACWSPRRQKHLSGQGTVNSFSETAALEMISRDKTRLCFLMFKTGSTVATSGRIFMVYSYGSGPAHLAAISETAMSAAAIPTRCCRERRSLSTSRASITVLAG
jgi:hypothetical protein